MEPKEPESIAVFLNDFRDGKTLSELTEAKRKVIEAMRASGKAASFTWTFSVKPASKADGDKAVIHDDIRLKLPEPGRSEDFFFVTENGGTSRKHPRQRELELREVSHDRPTQFKEVK